MPTLHHAFLLHASYYVALAEEAQQQLSGENQAAWLNRLEAEHDNIRSVLRWCLAPGGDKLIGVRLAASLWRFWEIRGYYQEGLDWLVQAIQVSTNVPPSLYAAVLDHAGSLAYRHRDLEAATYWKQQSLARYEELGDRLKQASVLNHLGIFAAERGEVAEALERHEQSLAFHREIGGTESQGGAIRALNSLAVLAWNRADFPVARDYYLEAAGLAEQTENAALQAEVFNNLGPVYTRLGDYRAARFHLRKALKRALKLKHPWLMVCTFSNIGDLCLIEKRFVSARNWYKWALSQYPHTERIDAAAAGIEGLAQAAIGSGQFERGSRLFGAAEKIREMANAPWAPVEQESYAPWLAQAKAGMGEREFKRAWREGRDLTTEQTFAEAVRTDM